MMDARFTSVAIQESNITNINDTNSLASHNSNTLKQRIDLRNTHGPMANTPAKNSTADKTMRKITKGSSTPFTTMLLTTAKIISPRTSSNMAAPKIVFASRVFNCFISDKTRAVMPILVADKVAPTNNAA